MKLAYFSPSFPPIIGGMGTACYYTANEIGQSHEVVVFLPDRNRPKGRLKFKLPLGRSDHPKGRENLEYQTGNYKIKLFKPWFSFGYASCVPQILWRLKDFDLVHLYYPYFGVAEFLWLLKIIKGKKSPKIIFHYQMDMVGQGITKIVSHIHRVLIEPLLFKKVDAIFILSEDYALNSKFKKYWQKYRNKISVVPNGVDIGKFNIPLLTKEGLGEVKNKSFIIFTAQALDKQHYFKGIEILIKALHSLLTHSCPAIKLCGDSLLITLLIAGDGDLKKYYQNLAQKLNIADKIIFLGKVSHEELPKYYAQADVVAVPSTAATESFSITAVEAMACGKPVIVSNLPGLRATIENNISGLLAKPGDAENLAEKIKILYDQPELKEKLGLAARKKIEREYDWKKICQKIIEYYKVISN